MRQIPHPSGKPISGRSRDQNVSHSPFYPAGAAGCIALGVMPSIYMLRARCPFCGITLRPDRLRRHCTAQHSDHDSNVLAFAEQFMEKAIAATPNERLELDLQTLAVTFLDRRGCPTVQRSIFQQPCRLDVPSPPALLTPKVRLGSASDPRPLTRLRDPTDSQEGEPGFSLLKQMFCPFCRGTNGLESSHGCFYCG